MGKLYELVDRMADTTARSDWDEMTTFLADDLDTCSPNYDVSSRDAFIETIKAQNAGGEVQIHNTLVAETDTTVVLEWNWSISIPDAEDPMRVHGLSYFVVDDNKITKIRQYWHAET